MESMKTTLQKRYEEFWRQHYKTFIDFTDIGIELGDFLNDEKGGLVFVGVNPSGANKQYYNDYFAKEENKYKRIKENPQNAVIWYSPDEQHRKKDGFLKAAEKFVQECGYEHYSKLDVFCVVKKNQKDVQLHFELYKKVYREMFSIFADTIVDIRPKVIVVANAFVRDLFLEEGFDNIIKCERNEDFGGYLASINNGQFETQVYFSSMLSGQRALDVGSRENLIWLIRNYTTKNNI